MSAYTYFNCTVLPFTVKVPVTVDCELGACALTIVVQIRTTKTRAKNRTIRRETIVGSLNWRCRGEQHAKRKLRACHAIFSAADGRGSGRISVGLWGENLPHLLAGGFSVP